MKEAKEHYVSVPQATRKLITGRNGDLFPGHGRQMLETYSRNGIGSRVNGRREVLSVGPITRSNIAQSVVVRVAQTTEFTVGSVLK